MDSRGNTIPYRSVPLIQRGDMSRFGGLTSPERPDDGSISSRKQRTERALRDTAPVRESSASRRSRSAAAATPQLRESVSAYLDESTAGRVTPRSERRRTTPLAGRGAASAQGGLGGFSLVGTDASAISWPGSRTPESAFAHVQQATASVETMRGHVFDDYDGSLQRGLPGRESRRSAVVSALCFVPEAVGSAVLGALGRLRVTGIAVLAVVLLAVAALYEPARDLYITNRKLDTLQQTYDVLLAENSALENELEYLQTREGIENEARERGYVDPGETKVVINGLPEEELSVYQPEEIVLPDERPWYVRVLDTVFGYEPEG